MRKFMINPIVKPANPAVSRRSANIRCLLIVDKGAGVLIVRDPLGRHLQEFQQSLLRGIAQILDNCSVAEHRLLWLYSGVDDAWLIRKDSRQLTRKVCGNDQMLRIAGRFLRSKLVDDEEITGFLHKPSHDVPCESTRDVALDRRLKNTRRVTALTHRLRMYGHPAL